MFRHRAVIFRESTKVKEQKSNSPVQVLVALTGMIKTLKYRNAVI